VFLMIKMKKKALKYNQKFWITKWVLCDCFDE